MGGVGKMAKNVIEEEKVSCHKLISQKLSQVHIMKQLLNHAAHAISVVFL